MKRNFKMVVVSLSFLIIGGILVACGHNKSAKITTTETVTTETATEEGTEIAYDGYRILLPEGYKLVDTEDGASTYQKSDDEILVIVTEPLYDEFDVVNEEYVKSLLEKSYLTDTGTEKSFDYKEGFGYKSSTYYVEYNNNGVKMLGQHFAAFDSVNKKMTLISFVLQNYKSDEEVEEATSSSKNVFENFIKTNFGSQ